MRVVVNATPLIALSLIDRLDLLHQLFDEVLVRTMVYEEVVMTGSGGSGSTDLEAASWIQVRTPSAAPTIEPMLLGLDPGEFQVLLLAREVQSDWVLIDERRGRRIARALRLSVKGTVGILLAAVHADLLSRTQAVEAVQRLIAKGIRIGPEVLAWFEAELDRR